MLKRFQHDGSEGGSPSNDGVILKFFQDLFKLPPTDGVILNSFQDLLFQTSDHPLKIKELLKQVQHDAPIEDFGILTESS